MTDKPKKSDNDNEPDKEPKTPPAPIPQDALTTQVQALESDPKILIKRIDSLEKTIQELTNENREEKKKAVLEQIKKIRPALAEKHKDATYDELKIYLEILEDVGPPPDFPVLGLNTKDEPEKKPALYRNRLTGELEYE